MDWKQVVGGFVLLILVFLLVNNGTNTAKVIESLSSATTSETKALQGKG